jgi:hypothetical protein
MRLHFTLAFLLFSVFGVFAQDISKEAIAQSVKLAAKPASTTVQFKYRKQDYTYDYSRGSDGLRLNE